MQPRPGKRQVSGWCASSYPSKLEARLPIIEVSVMGRSLKALVDSGCMVTVVYSELVGQCEGSTEMVAFDGSRVTCVGLQRLEIGIGGAKCDVDVVVAESVLSGVMVVLGMNVIEKLGGVRIHKEGMCFEGLLDSAVNHQNGSGETSIDLPAEKMNEVRQVLCKILEDVDFEVDHQSNNEGNIDQSAEKTNGIQQVEVVKAERGVSEKIDDVDFTAVFNGQKWTVSWSWKYDTPTLNVACYSNSMTDVVLQGFDAELERWIEEGILKPWHETIYEGIIPLMAVVQPTKNKIRPVLDYGELNQHVNSHTGIDDIDVCNERIREWRKMGGAEKIIDLKAAYLQIHVSEEFTRGNEIPKSVERLSKRHLFSVCVKLVGHYPVAGWLMMACSFIKRLAADVGWKKEVGKDILQKMNELLHIVRMEDPVKGLWYVPPCRECTVSADASSIALGVVIEIINARIVEDAPWLRKKSDYGHINVAELEAVMKGINLALKWGATRIKLMTDSATVCGWLRNNLTLEKRILSKGASELLVKRRLGILNELLAAVQPDLKALHEMHHMGVDRTLFLAMKVFPNVSREVVKTCEKCQSIDPAPALNERGKLSVFQTWSRIAIDVTQCRLWTVGQEGLLFGGSLYESQQNLLLRDWMRFSWKEGQ